MPPHHAGQFDYGGFGEPSAKRSRQVRKSGKIEAPLGIKRVINLGRAVRRLAKRLHKRAQPLFRRRVGAHIQQRRMLLKRFLLGMTQHFGIERFLVAEMIVDRRDVRAGAPADLPHGCGAKSGLGEHRARRLQQLLARRVVWRQ